MRTPLSVEPHEPLPSLISRLFGETRELANAEFGVYKAKIGRTLGMYKSAAVLFAVAGVLSLAALVALLVGAILTIATLVGPGWATLIVVGVTLMAAAVLALVGKSKLASSASTETIR